MFKKTFLSLAVASAVTLVGCGSNDDNANAGSRNPLEGPLIDQFDGKVWPIFNPAVSQLPVPSDFQFESDGTFAANAALSALDFMDGASTIAPVDIKFTGSIDATKVDGNTFAEGTSNPNPTQNVFLLKLTYPSGDGLLQVDGEVPTFSLGIALQDPVTNAADIASLINTRAEVLSLDGVSDNLVRITPLEPLDPASKYLVIITNEVTDLTGEPVSDSPSFSELKGTGELASSALLPARAAVNGWLALAEGWFGAFTNLTRTAFSMDSLTADNVAIAYTFTTAGTTGVLASVADPEVFFESSVASTAKKEAIALLNTDMLLLDPAQIATVLTDPDIDAETKCINAALASTIPGLGLSSTYERFSEVTDATEQFTLQFAVATIGNNIADEDAATIAALDGALGAGVCGDNATNAQEAAATVTALTGLGGEFPTPEAQDAAFYTTVPSAAFGLTNTSTFHLGQLSLPYYLETPTDSDATNLTSTWQASESIGGAIDLAQGNDEGTTPPSDKITYRFPFPTEQAEVDVPLLVQVPDAGTCAANCPVVIYQHGIFGNRGHSIALGNQLAAAGYVTVAIDLPLHGVAPTVLTDPVSVDPLLAISVDVDSSNDFADPAFKALPAFANLSERHFGWANPTGVEAVRMEYSTTAADAVGASGQNFINLSALQTTRDYNRQAVVDLLNLNASLDNISTALNGAGGPTLDTSSVYFVGHSLGGIVGTVYAAVNNFSAAGNPNLHALSATALVTTGGGTSRLLENSQSIGSSILAGLASNGVTQGSSSLETFLSVSQGISDSADPLNFAEMLAGTNAVYLNEIFGDGSTRSTQDSTIPPAADIIYDGDYTAPLGEANPAPLAGTEPLIKLVGADVISADGAVSGNDAVVRFTAGTHTTIISPLDATQTAVFADMATNIISFFGTNGAAISFNNATFVKTDAPEGNPDPAP